MFEVHISMYERLDMFFFLVERHYYFPYLSALITAFSFPLQLLVGCSMAVDKHGVCVGSNHISDILKLNNNF